MDNSIDEKRSLTKRYNGKCQNKPDKKSKGETGAPRKPKLTRQKNRRKTPGRSMTNRQVKKNEPYRASQEQRPKTEGRRKKKPRKGRCRLEDSKRRRSKTRKPHRVTSAAIQPNKDTAQSTDEKE